MNQRGLHDELPADVMQAGRLCRIESDFTSRIAMQKLLDRNEHLRDGVVKNAVAPKVENESDASRTPALA